jgi:hypothetical protein
MNKSMAIMEKKKNKKGKCHSCGMVHDIDVKGRKKGKKRERERGKRTLHICSMAIGGGYIEADVSLYYSLQC